MYLLLLQATALDNYKPKGKKELKCIGIKEGQILEIYKLTEINLVLCMYVIVAYPSNSVFMSRLVITITYWSRQKKALFSSLPTVIEGVCRAQFLSHK